MPGFGESFIVLSWAAAFQVVLLGFVGGVLSGFIGSGGAFFMTPGMMNLGVPGVVAVGSNITHKFGKAMMGSKKHAEMGNVDKKLGVFLILTSAAGIRLAVHVNSMLFAGGAGKGAAKSAAADLYISGVFVSVLSLVAVSILRDAWRSRQEEGEGPSLRIAEWLSGLRLFPMISFPVADVKVSLWILLIVGLATGYMAGTIGVGGFIGVPAMIYVFGVPTTVAAGTELFLAMFMGAFGALNYVYEGMVDIRLTLLLYLGSLVGVYLGAYGTKVVKEVMIRVVTGLIILLCVLSRGIAIPIYLRQLGWVNLPASWDGAFNAASKALLFASGITGVVVILFHVFRAYWQRGKIHASLTAAACAEGAGRGGSLSP
ncbi:MAG: sulfite exporter TauE/SafE family protein [Elusimicrobia bacterium]|nr:sulfite exporter TauE/SafE family protein [Elusimicrobiota bacterium]